MNNSFDLQQYYLRRKFFKLFGANFKIFDTEGNLRFFVNQKAFKLREDIRVYSDESMSEELLLIKARKIIDFAATYDIFDSKTNEKLGSFRRKGFKSILRDEWFVMDSNDIQVGMIKEDSALMAFLRRFITSLIPQTFECFISGIKVFTFKQRFNPFILKMDMNFYEDQNNIFDRRMGICAGILLGAIEGRQG